MKVQQGSRLLFLEHGVAELDLDRIHPWTGLGGKARGSGKEIEGREDTETPQ